MMQSKYIIHPVMDDDEENEKENKPGTAEFIPDEKNGAAFS
jgi:hypothetical protein